MQLNEKEIALLRRHWAAEELPLGLATRISARATALPQQRPFLVRAREWFDHSFSEWNYALAYKGAVLAAVAIMGIYSGQVQVDDNSDITAAIMGDTGVSEGL